ncbi:ATP-dependent dethiobiotin synthetase BioD [Betaproteobacteria bacterium]|nr:ATP-dependent dethiobiotin synthetase BioD [Betaproteobacteria bacterium]GHT99159.1 ATP-dependent dethiobiotin synthetase BioD [Betaproteobacteria bacterium]GHU21459.1 ATP-dependent dethiobiotin synthetase BioD [Betaproteobacteria bacterium]
MNPPARAWFITGTDTEIGKTFATTILIHAFRNQGFTTLGMKPVAAGAEKVDGQLINDDVVRIRAASSFDPGITLQSPYCLRTPASPHIAARKDSVHIDPMRITQAFVTLRNQCERLLVEGVGGFRVPLGEHFDSADLACELAVPVILVVGLRLGCINHALLTMEAIKARGLRLAGWVANAIDPAFLHPEGSIELLHRRLDIPFLGTIPYSPGVPPANLAYLITLPT